MAEGISDADQLCDLILNSDNLFDKLQLPLPRLNILGVAEWKLTLPDIKKAYRDISLKVHPDKCTSERANDAFLAVGTAFRTLSDDREREIYINAFGEKLKQKQSAVAMSQGWSQSDSGSAAVVATSLGIAADLVAAATPIELDVAIARQERLSAVAYQRASFQKHGDEMVQQMQARRSEHIATKEKEREIVQKRAYQRINQPAQPSSEESSSSEESDSASDDDDDAALRNLAALKQRKKKFARQL